MSIHADIQKLAPGAIVELYVLDMTALGAGISYFHAGTDQLGAAIVWQGHSYAPWPVQATGFEINGRGQSPRPKISMANINGAISAFNRDYQDLVGAKVIRKRTFARYLDGQPEADPTAEFPEDVFYVERKARDNGITVEYELAGIWDVEGVKLPRRTITANVCTWRYRVWSGGAWDYAQAGDCGYTGEAMFDADDQAVADPALDVCGKRLSSCKARWGEFAELPYGGFPGVGLVR